MMQDIFETNELYPNYETSFKKYFKDYFEEVLICLSPFFTMGSEDKIAVQASKIISLDELQEQDELYKKLEPSENRIIYAFNPDYPVCLN